jgi:DNA gyrase subunit A
MAEAAKDKRIEGVSDIRDESNREGVRVVIDLKRDASVEVVLNQLWRHTPAQASFPANMLAIRGGRPETLNLKDIIEAFVRFREEVITRRSKYELAKARERAHILLGLVIAVTNLDEVVRIIRGSPPRPKRVRPCLPASGRSPRSRRTSRWSKRSRTSRKAASTASPTRRSAPSWTCAPPPNCAWTRRDRRGAARARRLHRRAARDPRRSPEAVRSAGGRARRRVRPVRDAAAERDHRRRRRDRDEDLITREDMVVTVTMEGYIKRTPLDTFRAQAKGGKGRAGMATKDEDAVTHLFVTSTHTPVLFFSTEGKVYRMKVWRLPEGGPATRGRPMVNLLPLATGETISTVLPLPEDEETWGDLHVMFATAKGSVRRNSMDAFANIRRRARSRCVSRKDQTTG